MCVWGGGQNKFDYKISLGAIYGKERFLQTLHVTQNNAAGIDAQGEGCDGYWCWRVERYNCIDEEAFCGSPWWRRDSSSTGYHENDGEECPGKVEEEDGNHPCHPD